MRRRRLPIDDPGRLAEIRVLVALRSSDATIGRHLEINEERVYQIRRYAGIPPGRPRPARRPSPTPFDLEDSEEL